MNETSGMNVGIRENGTIENPLHGVETCYQPCIGIALSEADGVKYIRVFMDDNGGYLETRILFSTLDASGFKWVKP